MTGVMTAVMRAKSTLLLFFLASLLSLTGCSAEKGESDAGMCNALTGTEVRAPEGDSLCAATTACGTSGQPDHQGCPNTCGCLCRDGLCYQGPCTQIGGCAEPPVYR